MNLIDCIVSIPFRNNVEQKDIRIRNSFGCVYSVEMRFIAVGLQTRNIWLKMNIDNLYAVFHLHFALNTNVLKYNVALCIIFQLLFLHIFTALFIRITPHSPEFNVAECIKVKFENFYM